MDRISDLFAFRGGHQGSGRKSPPPPQGRQQGQEDVSYNGFFSLNLGVGGASDRGVPTCTILWDLYGGTGGNGDEEPGDRTRSPWVEGAVLGSRLLPLAHSRGRRPTEPLCLDSAALGTHFP